ncbi:triacylglycerol lipase [Croceicoccus sp. YJ47]|uniref:esterase/lipase family protein n=1 Tax=Croceicoccus sp. YJ47 TaxID=2798724 RepID=UPI001F38BAB3|nr:alpha/beta fold hydrolase [Croceicoccus sp. YJ47]
MTAMDEHRQPAHGASGASGARTSDKMRFIASEWRRRRALARMPQPDGVARPNARLILSEFASAIFPHAYAWSHGRVRVAPADEARTVMLVPGFGSHPWRMAPLRRALEKAGHTVVDWGLGWNLGADAQEFERLCARITLMARSSGAPIVLIGWSLGGVYAREAAKRVPDDVEMVVTMGSPFSGDMHGNNAWRIYHAIAGHTVDDPPVGGDLAKKPPVPTIALWSARDGIVHRHCAGGKAGERDEMHHVRCTHMGFAWHPAAIQRVLAVLDRHLSGTDTA